MISAYESCGFMGERVIGFAYKCAALRCRPPWLPAALCCAALCCAVLCCAVLCLFTLPFLCIRAPLPTKRITPCSPPPLSLLQQHCLSNPNLYPTLPLP